MSLISTLLYPPKTKQPPTLRPGETCGAIRRVSIAAIEEAKPRPPARKEKRKPCMNSPLMAGKHRDALEFTERVFRVIAAAGGEVTARQVEIETGAVRSTVLGHIQRLIKSGRVRLVTMTGTSRTYAAIHEPQEETA